jgi:hypothetical protein
MGEIATNNGKVALASCCHVYANQYTQVSDAELTRWSARTALISLRPSGMRGRERVLTGSKMLWYTKTLATQSGSLPEKTYAHTLGGKRKGDPNWGVWILDPWGEWKAIHLRDIQNGGFATADGVFNDSAGDFPYTQGGKPYRPTAYTSMIPVAEWRQGTADLLQYWMNNGGQEVHCINGLNANSMKIYPPQIGMLENAFGSNQLGLPSSLVWHKNARIVCDAQGMGWTPWMFCKMRSKDPAVWTRWRNYMTATTLLLDRGSLLFELGGMEGTTPPYTSKEWTNAAYSPNLGAPLETAADYMSYRQTDGTLVRKFQNGRVIVDPARQTSRIAIP